MISYIYNYHYISWFLFVDFEFSTVLAPELSNIGDININLPI